MLTSCLPPSLFARSRRALVLGTLAVTALASGCSSSAQAPGHVAGGAGGNSVQTTSTSSTSGGGEASTGSGGAGAGSGGAGSGGAGSGGTGSGGAGAGSGGADAGPPATCAALLGGAGASSTWVSVDAAGKLEYAKTPKGDTILDFSYAGYMAGGVAIPTVPAATTVSP